MKVIEVAYIRPEASRSNYEQVEDYRGLNP